MGKERETDRYTNTAEQRGSPHLDPAMSWCQLLIFSNDGSFRYCVVLLTTASDNSTNSYLQSKVAETALLE